MLLEDVVGVSAAVPYCNGHVSLCTLGQVSLRYKLVNVVCTFLYYSYLFCITLSWLCASKASYNNITIQSHQECTVIVEFPATHHSGMHSLWHALESSSAGKCCHFIVPEWCMEWDMQHDVTANEFGCKG